MILNILSESLKILKISFLIWHYFLQNDKRYFKFDTLNSQPWIIKKKFDIGTGNITTHIISCVTGIYIITGSRKLFLQHFLLYDIIKFLFFCDSKGNWKSRESPDPWNNRKHAKMTENDKSTIFRNFLVARSRVFNNISSTIVDEKEMWYMAIHKLFLEYRFVLQGNLFVIRVRLA